MTQPHEYVFSSCKELSDSFEAGKYLLEVYGASGGTYGGKGGYSKGILTLSSLTTLFIFLGGEGQCKPGQGSKVEVAGGCNGGGTGQTLTSSDSNWYTCSGGGGTDIRIESTSLDKRVIVAGGGGGGYYSSDYGTYLGG
jgi:hypothetical protein